MKQVHEIRRDQMKQVKVYLMPSDAEAFRKLITSRGQTAQDILEAYILLLIGGNK